MKNGNFGWRGSLKYKPIHPKVQPGKRGNHVKLLFGKVCGVPLAVVNARKRNNKYEQGATFKKPTETNALHNALGKH